MQPAIRLPERYDLNVKSSAELPGVSVTTATSAQAFVAAGGAVLVPFQVYRSFSAARMAVKNGGTVNGNTTMGIYDTSGSLLASTAATAQTGTSVVQIIALQAAVTLREGLYFMALSNSGTTGLYETYPSGPGSNHYDITALGCRGIASGGIVDSPAIVDITTASLWDVRRAPALSVLAYASDELVAA